RLDCPFFRSRHAVRMAAIRSAVVLFLEVRHVELRRAVEVHADASALVGAIAVRAHSSPPALLAKKLSQAIQGRFDDVHLLVSVAGEEGASSPKVAVQLVKCL